MKLNRMTSEEWGKYLKGIIGTDEYIAYEIGVATYKISRVREMFTDTKAIFHLFEPLPQYFNDLQVNIFNDNVRLHNVGLYKETGQVTFNEFGQESHIDGVSCPGESRIRIIVDTHTIDVVSIEDIDNGDIDILLVDAEGCEWYAIENLISRPKIIVLEMTTVNKDFVNPHSELIENWMKDNNYTLKDTVGGDSVFIKE